MYGKENQMWAEEMIAKLLIKMEWVREKTGDKIPYTVIKGNYDDKSGKGQQFAVDDGLNWWCNGFWGGMMWLMYLETAQESYAETAVKVEEKLDKCLTDFYGLHHDVGFMWLPTAVTNYRITGNSESRKRAVHAANILAGRFNPAGQFIRAWNDPVDGSTDTRGWAIIDCLMNIPLLYWASEETQDPRFRQIGMLHADTAMTHFVREDGSVRHIVAFHPDTGEMLREYGGQGYAQGSSWARGQAWGLYGFVISYKRVGKRKYLDTAKRIAHYYIANIPESGLIPVDFRQPPEPFYYDDTAAAIAANGLLELAKQVGETEQALYTRFAVKLLQALAERHCCWGKESDALLQCATAAYHDTKHEFPIIYGDYFFIEALLRLKGDELPLW